MTGGRKAVWLGAAGVMLMAGLALAPHIVRASAPETHLAFDTGKAAPRAVEETTAKAVERDYGHAWQELTAALENNHADLLEENFTGGARTEWQEAIRGQQQNGLSRRIVDHGHTVRVIFYSLDGSAMEALDTAELEIEYREGSKVLSSERVQARYLVLLTPAENSWKVRILQEVPAS